MYASQLQHKRILSPYGAFFGIDGRQKSSNFTACLVYEFMENGDLLQYIQCGGCLPAPIARYYARQLVEAVLAMHQAGVCHRDLKLDNLVLDSDFNLKVIDFGLACSVNGTTGGGFCDNNCGTEGYKAPEITAGIRYQPVVADLFSLAVILFIIYTGRRPFCEANPRDDLYLLFCHSKQRKFWDKHEKELGR